jgi:P27 family predicted phage terminase small subunit
MARHPLPAAIKKARGTDRPSRMNDEPEYKLLTKVQTPSVLKTARARKIFKDKAAQLIAQRILQAPDIDLLTSYANTYDLYLQAVEKQAEEKNLIITVQTKNGMQKQSSPYIKLQRELLPLINSMGAQFGFSPASRSKVNPVDQSDHDDKDFS